MKRLHIIYIQNIEKYNLKIPLTCVWVDKVKGYKSTHKEQTFCCCFACMIFDRGRILHSPGGPQTLCNQGWPQIHPVSSLQSARIRHEPPCPAMQSQFYILPRNVWKLNLNILFTTKENGTFKHKPKKKLYLDNKMNKGNQSLNK